MTESGLPEFEQAGFRQLGVFTSGRHAGRTGDWRNGHRFYRRHDLRSRYQQGIADAPSYDPDSAVLTYSVCGLRLVDPNTHLPLPDPAQYRPPSTFPPRLSETPSLFIDSFKRGHGWAFNGTPRSSGEVKNRATIYPGHRGPLPCEIFGTPKSSCLAGCHI